MAKKVYVGVDTEVPVYEGDETVFASDALLEQYFSVSRGDYSFYYSTLNGRFESDNAGCYDEEYDEESGEYYESSTGAYIELTAKANYNAISFSYGVSSEANCDTFEVYINGDSIINISGEETGSWSGSIAVGDIIEIYYNKDSNSDEGEDCGWITNFKIGNKTQIGTEIRPLAREVCNLYIGVENIARPIYKAYVGVGGVARPFWHGGAGQIEYYGEITPLRSAAARMGAASTKDYAFFGGGFRYGSSTHYNIVYAYDSALTQFRDGLTLEKKVESPGAAAIDDYIVFSGGYLEDDSATNSSVAFSNTLTKVSYLVTSSKSKAGVASTNINNDCIIFAGGAREFNYNFPYDEVSVYSPTLTYTSTTLPFKTVNAGATSIGDYAIIGGGGNLYFDDIDSVCAINKDLTVTNIGVLKYATDTAIGEHTSKHAVFDTGDVYDKDLTHTTWAPPSGGGGDVSSPLGDYAIFGAMQPIIVSPNLSAILAPECTAVRERYYDEYIAGAEVGRYALFAGGVESITSTTLTGTNAVTAYTL